MPQSEQDVLHERLGRYPADRYPVQHATTQFHLGSVLLQSGDAAAALGALGVAQQVFSAAGMQVECAKAGVMVGVALRSAQRPEAAADALRAAYAALEGAGADAEQAAAAYNLGLVLADVGDSAAAREAWHRARELFLSGGYALQAAAAAREHGASLLMSGDADAALPLLVQAASLAERGGDDAGTAAAANVLGLAHLAAGDATSAVEVLRRATGFAPRTVRPADHAMVKANLALAYEQDGSTARARLAAAQALAVPDAAAPVRAQAQDLLGRLPGRLEEDLLIVLDDEDAEGWVVLLREEVLRVADGAPAQRQALVRGLLDGVLTRPGRAYDLVEALLQVVLELPPRPYAACTQALVAACARRPPAESDRLRAVIGSALARFAIPQWQRLAGSLDEAAAAAGEPGGWR